MEILTASGIPIIQKEFKFKFYRGGHINSTTVDKYHSTRTTKGARCYP